MWDIFDDETSNKRNTTNSSSSSGMVCDVAFASTIVSLMMNGVCCMWQHQEDQEMRETIRRDMRSEYWHHRLVEHELQHGESPNNSNPSPHITTNNNSGRKNQHPFMFDTPQEEEEAESRNDRNPNRRTTVAAHDKRRRKLMLDKRMANTKNERPISHPTTPVALETPSLANDEDEDEACFVNVPL